MTIAARASSPRILPGLGAVADRYDAFVLDLWGCVHDGLKPYPGVPETLAAMRGAGKRVLMLSNVPRRVAKRLRRRSSPPGTPPASTPPPLRRAHSALATR